MILAIGTLVVPLSGASQLPPEQYGAWQPSFNLPHPWNPTGGFKAVHMALIPTPVMYQGTDLQGKVLVFGPHKLFGPPRDEFEVAWKVIDPALGDQGVIAEGVLVTAKSEGNIFCSGHSWDPTGRLFVAGGMLEQDLEKGAKLAYFFDPNLLSGNPWVRQADLAIARYYPTVTLLADDNKLLVLGGQNEAAEFEDNYEVFDWFTGIWDSHPQPEPYKWEGPPGGRSSCKGLEFYPRIHLLPDGQIFFSSFMQHSASINHLTRQNPLAEDDWNEDDYGHGPVHARRYPESILMPLSLGATYSDVVIHLLGGRAFSECGQVEGGTVTEHVEEMDLGGQPPHVWDDAAAADMNEAREFPNAVQLPDETILVIGGEADGVSQPTLTPELWKNGSWSSLSSPDSARGYHSTAVLLPDGSVLSAGGDDRVSDFQVFEPPYLHSSFPRPNITSLSSTMMSYGQSYTVDFTGPLKKIVLIRPGSATHHFDFDQRMVILHDGFDTSGSVVFSTPSNPNLAPPGYYMFFVVSGKGIPSVADWILLS